MKDFTYEFQTIESEFSRYRQAAGLTPLSGRTFDSPGAYQRAQIRALQATLPTSTPASVRGALSPQATADVVATTAARVKAAVLANAHASPTLRPVTVVDRTGRQITEFYGAKRSWMRDYAGVPLLMTRIGDATC